MSPGIRDNPTRRSRRWPTRIPTNFCKPEDAVQRSGPFGAILQSLPRGTQREKPPDISRILGVCFSIRLVEAQIPAETLLNVISRQRRGARQYGTCRIPRIRLPQASKQFASQSGICGKLTCSRQISECSPCLLPLDRQ